MKQTNGMAGVCRLFLQGILLAFMVALFLAACRQSSDQSSPPDDQVVWDKQVQGGYTYLLVRNVVGFADLMEGVQLYRYPTALERRQEKYADRYMVFDQGVDDMDRSSPSDKPVPRAVTSARLDLSKGKVYVRFNRGKPQVLDVMKFLAPFRSEGLQGRPPDQ